MNKLRVRTSDPLFLETFFERSDIVSGHRIKIPGTNAYVEYADFPKRAAFGGEEIITLILSFGSGVSASLVATWLYPKLAGRAKTIEVDRLQVELNSDALKIAIDKIVVKD